MLTCHTNAFKTTSISSEIWDMYKQPKTCCTFTDVFVFFLKIQKLTNNLLVGKTPSTCPAADEKIPA